MIDKKYNQERLSITEIAKHLSVSKSTISREIKRNSDYGLYNTEIGNQKAFKHHSHKYFFNNMKYDKFTELFLQNFKKNFFGINATYQYINSGYPEIKKPCLRQVFNLINSHNWVITPKDRLHHHYRKGDIHRLSLLEKVGDKKYVYHIKLRPESTNLRQSFGDWEVDLIIGSKYKNHDHLLTFIERCSRKVYVARVKNKNPFKIKSVIKQIIEENKLYLRRHYFW